VSNIIAIHVYMKGDERHLSNFQGFSLVSTSHNNLSNILLLRLSPYVGEIIADYRYRFLCDKAITDQILPFIGYVHQRGSTMKQHIRYSQTSKKPMIRGEGKDCTIFS
jgi:hypothetical protein